MKRPVWIAVGIACLLVWAGSDVFARGGRGGGGRGGGGFSRGGGGGGFLRGGGGGYSRPSGGYSRPSSGYSRPSGIRTPSFSQPSVSRPSVSRPSTGVSRPSIGTGTRPSIGSGTGRPRQLPSSGLRPGSGTRPPIASTRPSTRPDVGRVGTGTRPSTRPRLAAGAGAVAGAGIANRIGERPASLPGLGDGRPGASQLPAGARRNQLQDRLAGGEGLRGGERPGVRTERDWGEVRQDWSDHRDEVRNDWQDHRDNVRNDWQDWHDDRYPWHGGWHWGYAPGYWGRWDYLWDEYPVAAAVGLTWWGANALGYAFGYDDYHNPYYSDTGGAVSYSEPIMTESYAVAEGEQPAEPTAPSQENLDAFDQGRVAFYDGKYEEALQHVDAAAVKLPNDAVVHEFRSLVLFALGRYSESAAAIHAVLAVGPGWDWKTLSSLYPSVDTYTTQLRALEDYCKSKPGAADGQFLLGYHYLTCGHSDNALVAFRAASKLQPMDTVSASLVRTLTPPGAETAPARVAETEPKAVPPDELVGTWTATNQKSGQFLMTLNKDGTFSWSFVSGERKETVKGVFAVEGNVLAMEPEAGGTMLAELTIKAPGDLHFQMVGGEKGDPGLDFKRD